MKKVGGGVFMLSALFAMAGLFCACSQADTVAVDLYDSELLATREYYDIFYADYFPQGGRYGAYCKELQTEVFEDRVRLSGLKEGSYSVTIGTEEVRRELRLEITSTAQYHVENGGFERGLLGWQVDSQVFAVSSEITFFDMLYTPTPVIGQQGDCFLDGFGLSSGFDRERFHGTAVSSSFLAAGSGYLTFQLGGGCGDELKLELMCGEEVVARFNNYLFTDPYASVALSDYYYQIPQEYMGKRLHFRLTDAASSDFGALTADSFCTYYPQAPDLEGKHLAGYAADVNSGNAWVVREGKHGTQRAYSPVFTVEDNLAFTLSGGNAERLKLRLIDETGAELAVFNNWRKTSTRYIYRNEQMKGKKLRFILDDAERLSDLQVEDIGNTQDAPDDSAVFLAGYCRGVPYDLNLHLRPELADQVSGYEFDDMNGWFTVDLEGYAIRNAERYQQEAYPDNPPVWNGNGNYLTGFDFDGSPGGAQATGTLYSRAFRCGENGWITFRMGGGKSETLALKLMAYDNGGNHTEIARFHNYLFSEPYRSMGMSNYGYRIPAQYRSGICFFALEDGDDNASYGAMSLDSIVIRHETAPQIYYGRLPNIGNANGSLTLKDDDNIYPAGFLYADFCDVTDLLDLEGATRSLKNGGFEEGANCWFSADGTAFDAYRVSSETTFFEAFYPNNIPVFNKTGNYFLNGFGNESFTGKLYSQAFLADGWITFKLGGGKSEKLKLRLMKYVDGARDEEIACFNNYLFSDPYRSMALTRYAYRIPDRFRGERCYFIIEDGLTTDFGAITADEFITEYAAPPAIDGKLSDGVKADKTFPAGFAEKGAI